MRETHGHARNHGRTPEYIAWQNMIQRCHNPAFHQFADYGGRGVSVCSAWRGSFEAFFAEVGERPSSTHSLDRRDNAIGYEPGNVRWATKSEQQRNRRTNRVITWNGQSKTAIEWSEETGITARLITKRIDRGWTVERALKK